MSRAPLYDVAERAGIVADAIAKASAEHGVPNSFAPLELVLYYRRGAYFTPMQVGRVAPLALELLTARGWTVTYEARRFRVTHAGPEYDA